jgi:DNA (cytosine-5)-methyltransferase 3A
MNVLSLFDGMSCGQIALKRAGIKVDNYYASEIDPYAIKITMKNYPKTIQLGSITEWQKWDIPKPDIIMGGSPCQGFSFAGKGLNFDDPRSKLFLEFHDIVKHYHPKYFLLENVIMSAQSNDVISSMLGDLYPECIEQGQLFKAGRLEPIRINSALVSAQNRERLYWTNIQGITQPEDKGILLRDIIEDGKVESGVSDKLVKFIIDKKGTPSSDMNRKSKCFTAGGHSGGSHSDMDLVPMKQLPHGTNKGFIKGVSKSPSMTTSSWENNNLVIKNKSQTILSTIHKENCKSMVNRGKLGLMVGCHQVGITYLEQLKNNRKSNAVYSIDAKGPTLTAICGGHQEPKVSEDNITWRKLTVTECERLQTVPEIEKNVIIRVCSDHQKNCVNAVDPNHRLPLSVGSAEKIDLKENAPYVGQYLTIRNQQIKKPVQYDVLISCGEHNIELLGPENIPLYVSNVGKKRLSSLLGSVGDFVLLSVGLNTIVERIITIGGGALLPKNNILVTQENGVNVVTIYGKGITQLVEDVEKNLITHKKLLKSIISGLSTQESKEQTILTLFSYVAHAIVGHIPKEIQNQNILTFQIKTKVGYTFGVSATRRYHALGNGWTVDIIAHIFSFLPNEYKKI